MIRSIAVIGARGFAGAQVVKLALEKGYKVTAIVRNAASMATSDNLSVVTGDVTNYESLCRAFINVDVVISCFGPSNPLKAGNLMSTGVKNIVAACESTGVKRFVFMSGVLNTDGRGLSLADRLMIKALRLVYQKITRDKFIAHAVIQKSAIDWVIAISGGLKDAPASGIYRAGPGARIAPFKLLPYADCAACLLRAAEEPAWTNQVINVGR